MLEIRNPATLESLGSVPDCGPDDVARAVDAARAALEPWRELAQADRAKLLMEIAARGRARERELATLLTRECGKPLCESFDCIDGVVALFEACAAAATPATQRAGVVAALVPFNHPLLLMAAEIAAAISSGNAVICKAPPQDPLACLMLADLFASLPTGLVTVLTGGPATGRALIEHPEVDFVAFTGSAEVGRRIAASAPRKPIAFELGGVDGMIVCEDADLDVVVPAIAWNRLMNGGQTCTAGKHIYVARAIVGEFVERMHQCVGFLDVDDPLKPATDLGPLISLDAAHRVEDQVGRTLRDGATLILGGRRFQPSGLPGHFFQPTILTNVRPGSVPMREEIRGPVITITAVAGLAEAIAHCAESKAALGASIYTRNPQAAAQLLESVPAGLFAINDPVGGNRTNSLAGMRHRAIRRLLAGESADAICQSKRLQVAARVEPKPWWFPYAPRNRAIRSR